MEQREEIQRLLVRLLATHPAGRGLCLIGGFRLRLLNQSSRRSMDVDYHWEGDLDEKQREVVSLLRRGLLPEVRRRFGLEGSVTPAVGPDADAPSTRIVEVAFYRADVPHSRIEIPVDITRIVCNDRPDARPVEGVVYLTLSDRDLIESKVIALFSRATVETRDLVDLFLFGNWLTHESAERVRKKMKQATLRPAHVAERLRLIHAGRDHLIRSIQMVLEMQMEPSVSENINAAGGAAMIFDKVWDLIHKTLKLTPDTKSRRKKRRVRTPMTTIEWRLYLEGQQQTHGQTSFTVTEMANVAGVSLPVLNVQLARLVKRGVLSRHARGRYGLPGALTPETLLPSLDTGAYLTGAHALYRHGLITQVPTILTCFTNRRHNRSRERLTSVGRLVFVCVKPPVYAPPPGGVIAVPEQALCDFVYLMNRAGVAAKSVVTFRNLGRLSATRLRRLSRHYPAIVGRRVEGLARSNGEGA